MSPAFNDCPAVHVVAPPEELDPELELAQGPELDPELELELELVLEANPELDPDPEPDAELARPEPELLPPELGPDPDPPSRAADPEPDPAVDAPPSRMPDPDPDGPKLPLELVLPLARLNPLLLPAAPSLPPPPSSNDCAVAESEHAIAVNAAATSRLDPDRSDVARESKRSRA